MSILHQCTSCGITNPRTKEFYHSSGKGRLKVECKTCANERNWTEQLIRKYGITVKQYNETLERQKHVCAICGKGYNVVRNGRKTRLCVDHDHTNGKVRGLLCSPCNQAIGLMYDNPKLLKNAIKYLEDEV